MTIAVDWDVKHQNETNKQIDKERNAVLCNMCFTGLWLFTWADPEEGGWGQGVRTPPEKSQKFRGS